MRITPGRRWLLVAMMTLVMLLQTQIVRGRSEGYRNISFGSFSSALEAKDFLLINVHVPYQGEIPGTDMLIPYHSVDRQKDRLPPAKDAKIVVYCQTGPMGYAAAGSLVKLGYTRVYHFEGGMLSWVRNGRQLIFRSDK